jgi:hypothetical protein
MSAEVFDQMVDAVEGLIRRSIAPLADELRTIEQRFKAIPEVRDGKDGAPGVKGDQGQIGPEGREGPKGDSGPMGEAGPTGPAGRDGSCFLVGEGPPLTAGKDGDVYLDTKTGDLYKCR